MHELSTPETPPLPPPAPSLWRSAIDALRGEQHDYTAVPLERAVLLLAVPMVIEMLMESVFTIVDIFWVSKLGRDAIAVVGLTESVMALVYSVAIGISFAATAIVSRRIGERNPALAAQAAGQIILLGAGLAIALGVGLGYFAGEILALMGAEPSVVLHGASYARIMFGGNITVFMIFVINAIFRGAGDATLAMRTLILANGINLVLDPCFIFGWGPFPELGVAGAAVATNIGRGVGVCYQLWHLTGKPSRVRISWSDLKPHSDNMDLIARTAGNGIFQLLISTTSWVGLFKILALFGSSVVAGYTIAIRMIIFALMPAWGLANAGATLVGQNLGALKPERAERAVRIASRYNVIFLGATGILFVVFSRRIAGIFTTDPEVMEHASRSLWIVSLALPIYAAGMCLEAAFNGAGDTWTPTRLNFFCFWTGQIPLAWILAHLLGWGPAGVYIAVPVSFSALAFWSWLLFRRGHWKQKKV